MTAARVPLPPPTPNRGRRLTAQPARARLLQHTTWSARTIQLAIGGRETTWTMNMLDMQTRQLVPVTLGSMEDACQHLACESVRAAIMTCGYQHQADRVWNHARQLIKDFHKLIDEIQ